MLHQHLTRREFAATSSAALLASLLPVIGCVDAGTEGLAPEAQPAAAHILSDHTEVLDGGVTRVTKVVSFDTIPPKGAKPTQTVVRTTTPTSTGEIIDYEITFAPALAYAIGSGSASRITGRYVFTFGPVTGDLREDTVVISGMLDGTPIPPVTKRVVRSLTPNPAWDALDSKQRLSKALELVNRYGFKVPPMPGMISVLG